MSHIIHLVRHGTHDEVGKVLSGRSEIALNPAGRDEAAALAGMFADLPLISVHSSPRRRAIETATPVALKRGLKIIEAPALDEIDFGGFTGRAFDTLEPDADWRRWNADRGAARCPGGETMGEAVARARDYVMSLPHDAAPALCVTHCDIIRGVVADLLGLPLNRIFGLECDPGSVTTLAIDGGAVRLVTLNARVPPPAQA